jgi:hypothetical protein
MTPREQIEALVAEWLTEASRRERMAAMARGFAREELRQGARFERAHAERLRAVLASWTPPDEKPVSHGASSAERQSPTKGADAGCDESVREFCIGCGDALGLPGEMEVGICLDCGDASRRVALLARASQGGGRP